MARSSTATQSAMRDSFVPRRRSRGRQSFQDDSRSMQIGRQTSLDVSALSGGQAFLLSSGGFDVARWSQATAAISQAAQSSGADGHANRPIEAHPLEASSSSTTSSTTPTTQQQHVTRENFSHSLPEIKQALNSCVFFSWDLEFSGLSSDSPSFLEAFEDASDRYLRVKSTATQFIPLQFGLSCFTWNPATGDYEARLVFITRSDIPSLT